MGLFDWFWRLLKWLGFLKEESKILIVGLDNAGKTSMLHMIKEGQFIPFDRTTSYHVEEIEIEGIKVQAYDIGGHESVRDSWKEYFVGANAIVFVVDSSDRNRMSEARKELNSLLRNEDLKDIPILVFGNKTDIAGALNYNELRAELELPDTMLSSNTSKQDRPLKLVMASVKQNFGLRLGFKWLAENL